MSWWVLVWIALAIAIFGVVVYNRLVALRQERSNSFADIDVQLKLRYDLIPNLVETVKGYAAHEKGVLENVTNARARAQSANSVDEKIEAEKQLGQALVNLNAVAENYPNLKADQTFIRLQSELSDIENKIAAARRFFNNTTAEYNTAVQEFPAVLIAKVFGFLPEKFFGLTEEEKAQVENVKVKF